MKDASNRVFSNPIEKYSGVPFFKKLVLGDECSPDLRLSYLGNIHIFI